MDYIIKTYFSEEEIKKAANEALKHRLYVSGWLLSRELKWARAKPAYLKNITITYKHNKPVGVIICRWDNMLQIFVRKSERKQGIGSKMISCVKTKESWASTGIDRTGKIWKDNGVSI